MENTGCCLYVVALKAFTTSYYKLKNQIDWKITFFVCSYLLLSKQQTHLVFQTKAYRNTSFLSDLLG